MKKLLLIGVIAGLAALTGCGDANVPYLTTIQIQPASPNVAAGNTQQLTATGTFSNGSTRDLTSLVTWSSSVTPVATIAQGGLATTYTQGASIISASFSTLYGVITASTTLNVTAPALAKVVVSDGSIVCPGPNSVGTVNTAIGTTHQFFAYGVYSDGSERNITNTVTWSSAPLTVATISNVGRATGISAGQAVITATDPNTSLSGTATLNVTNATISSIVVTPALPTIAPLTRVSFSAFGVFSDGTTQNITGDANWSSSDPTVATVTNSAPSGVATGVASGMVVIQAALGGVSGTAPLTVSAATLTSIAVTPASAGLAVGSTLVLQAVGTFSDGTTQPLNLASAWTVTPNDGSVATVDQTGIVTGVAAGTATVKAQFGAVSQTATITVENLTSVAIAPASASTAQGTCTKFVASGTLADGTTQDVTSSVVWYSTTPSIATVSNAIGSSGWATGIAPGTTNIGASFAGQFALAPLTVTNATVSSIAITPSTAQNIALGTWLQYTATATFSDSSTQDLSNQVTWTSSAPGVAVVNRFGLASSSGVGTTVVKAAANINGTTAASQTNLTVH